MKLTKWGFFPYEEQWLYKDKQSWLFIHTETYEIKPDKKKCDASAYSINHQEKELYLLDNFSQMNDGFFQIPCTSMLLQSLAVYELCAGANLKTKKEWFAVQVYSWLLYSLG